MCRILSLIALAAVLTCCGCLSSPNLAHPGPMDYQQTRAKVFEPFPDNDVGPPVVGGRPREYQEPVPETIRALQRPDEPLLLPYAQTPAQPAPNAQPPIITAPPIDTPPPAIYYPPGMTQ